MGRINDWLTNFLMGDDEGKFVDVTSLNNHEVTEESFKAGKSLLEEAQKINQKEQDAKDGLKLVIDRAKLKCDLCTVPAGDLKVNYDTPGTQDKRTATVAEKDSISLIFKGNCKKSPYQSSPCASVMKLSEWKNPGTVHFQDKLALLLKSSIKCEYGGIDIKITDCGQRNVIDEIDITGMPVHDITEETDVDFIVYPRVWLDDLENCNYGFDWNRDHDDSLPLRTRKKDELINNCVKGKDLFQQYYESSKIVIKNIDYYSPFLMMFENHGIVTNKEVVLSLFIECKDFIKLKNNFIKIDYNNSFFDVGFTNDGINIISNQFNFEKKYYKDEYFSTRRRFREEGGKIKSKNITNYEPDFFDNILEISNLMIKCKKTFYTEEVIRFLDKNNSTVGRLIVKPNNTAIFSNRKMCIVKIKRKNFLENDTSIIKSKLLSTYLINENGEEIKNTNANEVIKAIVKNINSKAFSKLLVNFSKEYDIDEFEINDDDFKKTGIISDSNVLKASEFLSKVENEYFSVKGIDKDNIKSKIFLFISPLEDLRPKIGAFVIHEELFTFSSILYNTEIYTLAHEIGHEMGLIHLFDNNESVVDKEVYVQNLERHLSDQKLDIEKWEASFASQRYPFPFTYYEEREQKVKQVINKVQWQEIINETKNSYKNQERILKNQKELLRFSQKMNEYHQIIFNKDSTENLMDYCRDNNTAFYFQHEIIKKLNDEFKHI